MLRTKLDHITITAPSLATGAAYLYDVIGVSAQVGGEHPRMGTHNLLLRLGEAMFLEIIAPNPAAPPPERPRWFALDSLNPQTPPRLSTWVVRTPDIHAAAAAASHDLGGIEPMSRGALEWLITLPPDGSLPLQGAAPALIQWQTDIHPASKLEDKGVSLDRLEILCDDPASIEKLLTSLALEAPVVVSQRSRGSSGEPLLIAHLHTPNGLKHVSNSNRIFEKPLGEGN